MKCQSCRKDAVISSSEGRYCAVHFQKNFEDRVIGTIKKYKLISKGEKIAVANSGGKDSLSLLYILSKYFSKTNRIVSVTIDEGIHGYRNKTIETMEEHCKRLGIDYKIYSYKDFFGKPMDEITRVKEGIPCATCGTLRRYLINYAAMDVGADKVATAHNMDDEAESVLMNLLQNDLGKLLRLGPYSGIVKSDGFVPRIKPFMFIGEKETMLFSILRGIDALHTPCFYAGLGFRGMISRKVKELESFSPGSKREIVTKIIALKEKYGESYGGDAEIGRCEQCGSPASSRLCDACTIKNELAAI